MSRPAISSLLLILAGCAGPDEPPDEPDDHVPAEVTPPDLALPVVPCDGSVLDLPLDLPRDAHHELFVLDADRISPGEGAEWAAGLDFFADEVRLPEDLPDWLEPAWPPPGITDVDTSDDTSTWSRQERWEPGWEDDQGNSEPGSWWHQGDVRFDALGRETGWREEPLFSSRQPEWRWTAYGPGGWTSTEVRRSERGWRAVERVRGLDGDDSAWRATDETGTEAGLAELSMGEGGGQLWLVNPWGRTLYVRELAEPDGYRAEIRATRWFEKDGVSYRPLIQANMSNTVGQENRPYIMDGRYELNEGQTLVELDVVGTQRVTTTCMSRTPLGVRKEILSHVVETETLEILEVGLDVRVDGRRVGTGTDTDGDGLIDTGQDRRALDEGRIIEDFDWRLVDGERVETVRTRRYLDVSGRPLREVRVDGDTEEVVTRWVHPG